MKKYLLYLFILFDFSFLISNSFGLSCVELFNQINETNKNSTMNSENQSWEQINWVTQNIGAATTTQTLSLRSYTWDKYTLYLVNGATIATSGEKPEQLKYLENIPSLDEASNILGKPQHIGPVVPLTQYQWSCHDVANTSISLITDFSGKVVAYSGTSGAQNIKGLTSDPHLPNLVSTFTTSNTLDSNVTATTNTTSATQNISQPISVQNSTLQTDHVNTPPNSATGNSNSAEQTQNSTEAQQTSTPANQMNNLPINTNF